jgi:hypothetical protein
MTSKNRQTGTFITVIDNGGFFTVACEDHDTCCEFENKTQANIFKASPADWCGECYKIAVAKAA